MSPRSVGQAPRRPAAVSGLAATTARQARRPPPRRLAGRRARWRRARASAVFRPRRGGDRQDRLADQDHQQRQRARRRPCRRRRQPSQSARARTGRGSAGRSTGRPPAKPARPGRRQKMLPSSERCFGGDRPAAARRPRSSGSSNTSTASASRHRTSAGARARFARSLGRRGLRLGAFSAARVPARCGRRPACAEWSCQTVSDQELQGAVEPDMRQRQRDALGRPFELRRPEADEADRRVAAPACAAAWSSNTASRLSGRSPGKMAVSVSPSKVSARSTSRRRSACR